METVKYIEDVPYDLDRTIKFVVESGFVPHSEADARKLADEIIQDYLDSYGDNIDENVIDAVENLIAHLSYNDQRSEQAVPAEVETILTPAERLDDLIIDAFSEGELKSVEAEYLMLLFQLRPSSKVYSITQRQSLGQQLASLQSKIKTKLAQEPTLTKNYTREYKDRQLQGGMDILQSFTSLMKLPSTKSKPPFTAYIDERVRLARRRGREDYYRDEVYATIYYLLEKAFTSSASQNPQDL